MPAPVNGLGSSILLSLQANGLLHNVPSIAGHSADREPDPQSPPPLPLRNTHRGAMAGRVVFACAATCLVNNQPQMITMKSFPKVERTSHPLTGLLLMWAFLASSLLGQETTSGAKPFESAANAGLAAMRARAEELGIKGVAVIAYAAGETINAWSSKMMVVGTLKTSVSDKDPGSNLLAIAYSKAAEMAETLKASGSGVRKPMKGEFGWQGGLIQKGKSGYLIAAFSGGKSEDDVKVSRAGLEALAKEL